VNVRIVDVERVGVCMLCTSVREEGGDWERAGSEAISLLSYTLKYVSLADLDRLYFTEVLSVFG
jgi:hypothetical protein